MRLRQCLFATGLVASTVTAAAAQNPVPERRSDRRPWVLLEPHFRRPTQNFFRFRMAPDRLRMLDRSLERAGRVRERARLHSMDRLRMLGQRELAVRDRLSDRMSTLRRGMVARERAMERVRDRLDQVRDQRRLMLRRRWRTI